MIKVKLYGLFRLDTGIKQMDAEVMSVEQLYPLLLQQAKEINPMTKVKAADIDGCVVLVNGKQSNKKTQLKDGDEVQLMSPVCGG